MKYNDLIEIIKDKDRVIESEKIDKKYLTDGLKRVYSSADVLVFPITTDEVSEVLKYAYLNNISITPRGAGTGLVGGTIPNNGGIIIDLSRMNKIINLDKETFTVQVESGVLLEDLQRFVEAEELFYPPDPGEKTATIGGNISTNAGGMRAVKYGVTRNYVRTLEVVLANGSILNLGANTVKDSTGLDLKDLFIGSEGTLGIITKALLKVIPKPKKSVSVIIAFNNLKDAILSVNRIFNSNAKPTAIEFIERTVISKAEKYLDLEFPSALGQAYLLLTFDGDDECEIAKNYSVVREEVLKLRALEFLILESLEDINKAWSLRGALVKAVEAVSEQEPIDIVLPINRICEFVDFTKVLEDKYDIEMVSFGHAGDGNIHLCVLRNGMEEKLWNRKSHELLKELYSKSSELKGLVSGEHGIGLTKREYFFSITDKEYISYMNSVKKIFDEKGILNSGKVFMK